MKIRNPHWEAYVENGYRIIGSDKPNKIRKKIKHKKCSTCTNNCNRDSVHCVKCRMENCPKEIFGE